MYANSELNNDTISRTPIKVVLRKETTMSNKLMETVLQHTENPSLKFLHCNECTKDSDYMMNPMMNQRVNVGFVGENQIVVWCLIHDLPIISPGGLFGYGPFIDYQQDNHPCGGCGNPLHDHKG